MAFWRRWKARPPAKPQEERKTLAFGLLRDIGQVRKTNQDQVLGLVTALPSPGKPISLGLFVVADGMGGHTGGEVASMRATNVVAAEVLQGLLMPALREEPPGAIQDVLKGAIHAANYRILDEASRLGTDMGTTLTVALLLERRVYVAHIGDSRLYTYGEEGLQVRTRDHSMVARLLELGQITLAEARDHPKRNYLYQSVGQQEEIEVDMASFSLEGCRYLLLCTDGLWGFVGEEILAEALEEGGDPQATCEQLVAQANEAGGEDNIAAVVVALPGASPDL